MIGELAPPAGSMLYVFSCLDFFRALFLTEEKINCVKVYFSFSDIKYYTTNTATTTNYFLLHNPAFILLILPIII